MKKQLLFFILMLLPLVANADAIEINGIYYNLISKNGTNVAEVTSNPNKYTGSVVIPESVTYGDKDYNVTSIGNSAFGGCVSLTNIIIPSSVTIIRSGAFDGCIGLIDIIIPNNVTGIGPRAFSGCSSLTSIAIPNSLTSIEEDAFLDCLNLNKVMIQDIAAWCGVTFENYGSNPAYYAHHIYSDETTEIKDVIIPNSVSSIKNYAFSGCTDLTNITIPNSVTYIGGSVFSGCTGLTNISLPNGITSIEGSTFSGCTGLTSITVPNSVTYIRGNAFKDCTSLANITIPDNVTKISKQAFSGCISLTSITIPNSVTDLDGYAFSGCSKLSNIIIGSGILEIRAYTFGNCPELADIYCFAENVPNTASNAFDGSYIELATLHVPAASVDAYKATSPWKDFKEITYIEGTGPVVRDGLKYDIEGDWAVVVGRNEDYHDVVIPEKITYKDKEYKVRVEQGADFSSGKRGAFYGDEGIYSYTDPYITSTAYSSNGGLCYHAINLKKVSCSSLTSIEGGYVTSTYHTAFAECSSLEEIDMPNLQRIGDMAFIGCNSLKDIDFPKLQYIEDRAFTGTSLQSINLPELLEASSMTFANCSSLKTIVIDKVESLGTKQHSSTIGGTFLNCTSLKEVVLPNIINIVSSSDNKWDDVYGNFEGCTSLEKVELGNKCEMIDKSTFKGCTALSQICSHSITPPTLESSAFDENTYSSATLIVHATALNEYKSTYPWSLFKNITTIVPLYKLTYLVDGNIYKEEDFAEGMTIAPEPAPTKDGYTFSGWSEIPETMPAHDVTITGSFTPNDLSGSFGENVTFSFDGKTRTLTVSGTGAMTDYDNIIDTPCYEIREGIHTIVVEDGITKIGSGNFDGFSNLTSVTLPNSLEIIGNRAFGECSSLELIDLPNSISIIQDKAFTGCSSLKSIVLPPNITKINKGVFNLCGLNTVFIPKNVTEVGMYAFGENNALTEIICMACEVPTTDQNAFWGTTVSNVVLKVPSSAINNYSTAEPWCNFKEIVAIDGEIPVTPKCATPVIGFKDGELNFTCETEGVEFVSEVTCADVKKYYDSSVKITPTFTISVYATKAGYDNSETATKVIKLKGDVNADGSVDAQDASLILQYVAKKITWDE